MMEQKRKRNTDDRTIKGRKRYIKKAKAIKTRRKQKSNKKKNKADNDETINRRIRIKTTRERKNEGETGRKKITRRKRHKTNKKSRK